MAHEVRHAAWQTERRFTVRLLPEDGAPADLASGLTQFLDAFDLASDWVNREDPARDGTASLEIVEIHDGVTEQVWTYTPAQPPLDFSPLTWAGVPALPTKGRKSRLRDRVGPAPVAIERAPAVAAPPPPGPQRPVAAAEPEPIRTEVAAVRETPRQGLRRSVRAAWADRVSRCCLIGLGASLWFTIGLADPHFLLPLLVFAPALWWRQRDRNEPAPEAEAEDWL